MAKAINWPAHLRDDILNEDCESVFCAFRLGTLYYDNQYWVPEEIIDIRVNHLRIRKAVILSPVERWRFGDITSEQLTGMKQGISTPEQLKAFLETTYNQPVTDNTLLSRVTYKNLPVDPEAVESPS